VTELTSREQAEILARETESALTDWLADEVWQRREVRPFDHVPDSDTSDFPITLERGGYRFRLEIEVSVWVQGPSPSTPQEPRNAV
jgi:hypothetical protein